MSKATSTPFPGKRSLHSLSLAPSSNPFIGFSLHFLHWFLPPPLHWLLPPPLHWLLHRWLQFRVSRCMWPAYSLSNLQALKQGMVYSSSPASTWLAQLRQKPAPVYKSTLLWYSPILCLEVDRKLWASVVCSRDFSLPQESPKV